MMALASAIQHRAAAWLVVLHGDDPSPEACAGLAAFTEEAGKFLVVAAIFRFSLCFDEALDGIVYGSLAGVGAAAYEIMAWVGNPAAVDVTQAEQIARLLGHPVMGGITASGLGFAALRRNYRPWGSPLWSGVLFLCGVGLHAAYDAIAFRAEDARLLGLSTVPHSLWAMLLMSAGLWFYAMLVWVGDRADRLSHGGIWKPRRTIRRFVWDAISTIGS
jgi:RsiW-degrading membrane proteinase PrsW (M82 family)